MIRSFKKTDLVTVADVSHWLAGQPGVVVQVLKQKLAEGQSTENQLSIIRVDFPGMSPREFPSYRDKSIPKAKKRFTDFDPSQLIDRQPVQQEELVTEPHKQTA